MTILLIGLLAVFLTLLWKDVESLRGRVARLEAATPSWEAPTPWDAAPPAVQEAPAAARAAILPDPVVAIVDARPLEEAEEREPDIPTMPDAAPSTPAASGWRFEDLFGRRLPIWAGGVTLTVAGVLLVRLSVEAGLLSPGVRVVSALLFGLGLIAGAEVARRAERLVADDRVAQALAGAGVGTLYAAVLAAANLYGLIGGGAAFVGLAAVTLAAGALSLRFGAPSAVLGLLGGLAAPALVGAGPANVPLLATYLALTVGGMCALAREQRWWWLGAAALAGGFGWGGLLVLSGGLGVADRLAIGSYALLLGIALPLLLGGPRRIAQAGAALAAVGQLALLLAADGFGLLDWGLFGLLSAALVWLGQREAALLAVRPIGLGTVLALMVAWPDPRAGALAAVLAGAVLLYGGAAATRLRHGTIVEAAQLAALAIATGSVPVVHFPLAPEWVLSGTFLLGAALAGGGAAWLWSVASRPADARFATLAITAAALAGLAAAIALPGWTLPPVAAGIALALRMLSTAAGDERVTRGSWVFGSVAALLAVAAEAEVRRAFGTGGTGDLPALLRWSIPAAVAACYARLASSPDERAAAEAGAVLFLTVALAQLLPTEARAPAAAMLVAGVVALRATPAAILCAAGVAAGWSLVPALTWLVNGTLALSGRPFYVSDMPTVGEALLRLVPAAAALLFAGRSDRLATIWRRALRVAGAVLGLMAAHILYRQLFGIDTPDLFRASGMAERTILELLLAAGALGCWQAGRRTAATLLGGLALAHFGWFTGLVQNPLWVEHAVGPWLVPAYGTAFALVRLGERVRPERAQEVAIAQMVLILVFALSALRQVATGSVLLTGGTGAAEDIARSLLAIALALGFLQVGVQRTSRPWRIGSLMLMLAAVAKVFLFDAASLDGLLRIASFLALGASLIGIGWFYSRHLPDGGTQIRP